MVQPDASDSSEIAEMLAANGSEECQRLGMTNLLGIFKLSSAWTVTQFCRDYYNLDMVYRVILADHISHQDAV